MSGARKKKIRAATTSPNSELPVIRHETIKLLGACKAGMLESEHYFTKVKEYDLLSMIKVADKYHCVWVLDQLYEAGVLSNLLEDAGLTNTEDSWFTGYRVVGGLVRYIKRNYTSVTYHEYVEV